MTRWTNDHFPQKKTSSIIYHIPATLACHFGAIIHWCLCTTSLAIIHHYQWLYATFLLYVAWCRNIKQQHSFMYLEVQSRNKRISREINVLARGQEGSENTKSGKHLPLHLNVDCSLETKQLAKPIVVRYRGVVSFPFINTNKRFVQCRGTLDWNRFLWAYVALLRRCCQV